jgi:hypothetical protein
MPRLEIPLASPSDSMVPRASGRAVLGRGLQGDRYFHGRHPAEFTQA